VHNVGLVDLIKKLYPEEVSANRINEVLYIDDIRKNNK